jgi:hypothetical protein
MAAAPSCPNDPPFARALQSVCTQQWQDAPEEERYNNLGAVAVLASPDWSTPEFTTFAAVKPRPASLPYYDYQVACDSGEEWGTGGGAAGWVVQPLACAMAVRLAVYV